MAVRTLVVAFALFLGMCIVTDGRPAETIHAFCKIVWLFGVPCDQVNMAIVTQIKAMGSYQLGPVTPDMVQANHTSAVGQMEMVNFTMIATAQSLGCHVSGSSMSASWFSLFDNGTNYCNLHNIILGSALDQTPGYVEFTNEWLCLGVGLSACK